MPDTKPWWQEPYRMIQTNLRQPDALYDQKALAREVREFGANVLLYNIGGIYAFYPTKLPLHAVNPYMEGDALGDAIEAARSEGLSIVGRYDMSKATRTAYEAHPEWFVHNRAGDPLEYNGTYQACLNGGWYQGYSKEIIRESLSKYDIDGVFFNMFGYRNFNYSGEYFGVCVCENCQRRFRDMYGKKLPMKEDFSDPSYADFLEFKDRTSIELQDAIYDLIKEVSPKTAMTGRIGKCDLIRLEVQRGVDRPQPEWPYQAGEQARWGKAYGLDKTVSSTSTNFVDFAWRFHAETGAYHNLRFAQQLANGATLDLYLLGVLDQDDKRPLKQVSELFQWHKGVEDHYRGLSTGSKIAIYQSRPTNQYGARSETGNMTAKAIRGMYRALVEERLPFDFLVNQQVEDVEGLLERYEAVVLPNITCISDKEATLLDAYVEQGGVLLMTGEVGLYDERGERRGKSALASAPFEGHPFRRQDMKGAYFKVAPTEFPLPDSRVVMLDQNYFVADPKKGSETLLELLPPQRFGPPELCFPDFSSDRPGVVSAQYGKGRTVWFPWHPDWQYERDSLPSHRTLITDMIKRNISPTPAVLEGRGSLELTVQHQEATGRTLVHIVNYGGQRNNLYEDPPAVHGLRLGVRAVAGDATLLVNGGTVSPEGPADENGYLWYALPPVEGFEAISIARA